MRDDQIRALVAKEIMHHDNVVMLRNHQTKIRLDSVTDVLSNPLDLILSFLIPGHLSKRVDAMYAQKATEYNKKLKEKLEQTAIREKLAI